MKVYEPKLLILVDYLNTVFIFRGVRRIADGSEVGVAVHGEVVGVVGIGVISGRLVFCFSFTSKRAWIQKPKPKRRPKKEKKRADEEEDENEEREIKEIEILFLLLL